jgi:hypothetical protein
MSTSHRFGIALIASVMLTGWVLPSFAAELPIAPLQKTERAATAKTAASYHPTRIAAAGWPSGSVCAHGCAFPLILGVAY